MKQLDVLATVIICMMVAGCSGTQVGSGGGASSQTSQGQIAAPSPNRQTETSPLKDPANILFKRGTYFDFNKYDIKPEYRSIILAHARYLKEHPRLAIVIQGNCDERGSRKYNQVLGLKRADAVKRLIKASGVPEKQIAVISFGKDKPDAKGHDEKSWALNRRADIVYEGENNTLGEVAPQNIGHIANLALIGK